MSAANLTAVTAHLYIAGFVVLTALVFGLGWAFLPLTLGLLLLLGSD